MAYGERAMRTKEGLGWDDVRRVLDNSRSHGTPPSLVSGKSVASQLHHPSPDRTCGPACRSENTTHHLESILLNCLSACPGLALTNPNYARPLHIQVFQRHAAQLACSTVPQIASEAPVPTLWAAVPHYHSGGVFHADTRHGTAIRTI